MPGCHEDLTVILENSGPTVLGEMAHIIGRMPHSARCNPNVGSDDSYNNLILLCPTHHTLIDKAPQDYPAELLLRWKQDLESNVAGLDTKVTTRRELFGKISFRLIQNQRAFDEWGPSSERALRSSRNCRAAAIWELRRIGVILPNNRFVSATLMANQSLLTPQEWNVAVEFLEHASFYEQHCLDPADRNAYLPFPRQFGELVEREALNE